MIEKYQKPAEHYDGLRLHQNENTGGCSPAVLASLASLRPDEVGFYPPYNAATRACANYLGVDPDWLTLVNGLDEGIMATAVAMLRSRTELSIAESIIPDPAFEIFAFDTEVVGGNPVRISPNPDYSFPLDRVLRAVTERTRVVFITNPNNPTGVLTPLEAVRTIAERIPTGAVVFLDEAYAEFSGVSFIPELERFRNVIVGRTFSKAFGLAGLRIGTLAGHPDTLESIRNAVPVYSVNVAAVVAAQAALQDLAFMRQYCDDVERSKTLFYAACDGLGLGYVKSRANFVLVKAGDRAERLVKGAAQRGIYLRDRSREAGLEGCLRVGTGIVAHTERCIAVFEEILCGAE